MISKVGLPGRVSGNRKQRPKVKAKKKGCFIRQSFGISRWAVSIDQLRTATGANLSFPVRGLFPEVDVAGRATVGLRQHDAPADNAAN